MAPKTLKHKQYNGRKRKAPAAVRMAECSICSENQPKYKCPKCRALYCSIACCKLHKEKCTGSSENHHNKSRACIQSKYGLEELPLKAVEEKIKRRKMLALTSSVNSGKDEWRLTPDMLNRLQSSEWLRNEVQSDGGLRQILVDIDCSDDRETALLEAKQKYPNFASFIDNMLVTCGVLVADDSVPGGFSLFDYREKVNSKSGNLKDDDHDDEVKSDDGSSDSDSDSDSETSDSDSSSSYE